MYKTLLNNELDKLNNAGIPYNIEPGKFNLSDMHEISANKPAIDLEGAI